MSLTFPSYRKLKLELGGRDAYMQIVDLAIADFLLNSKATENIKDFIKAKAEQHSVIVNIYKFDTLENIVGLNNIVTVYNSFESFFIEFQNDYNKYFCKEEKWRYSDTKINGETPGKFAQILTKVGQENIPDNHINYFNTIRNAEINHRIQKLKS